jgi:arylsulfatase A-like enzyme
MWGTQPLARSAIARLADVERIRATLPRETFRLAEQPGATHPDILLVTLGGVRADATPPYGGNAEMPVLRELGRQSALFQQTFTTAPAPPRALRSLLLGIDDMRVRAKPGLDPRHVLVGDRLHASGYETAAFICCKDLAPGLARGLDRIVIERDGARLADESRAWVTARDQAGTTTPLFVWVHLDLPPSAGTATGPVDRRTEYNARLVGVDASLRQIIAGWQARPPTRAPIIIIAGVSGMGLGDHDQVGDTFDLYNSHVRVPFLISGPALKVQQIAEPVSSVDIAPTLLELAGFIPPPNLDGRSLAKLVRGNAASKPTEGGAYGRFDRNRMAVRGQWKLILLPGEPLLFDLRSDPFERTNQAPRKVRVVEQLTKLAEDHEKAMKVSPF